MHDHCYLACGVWVWVSSDYFWLREHFLFWFMIQCVSIWGGGGGMTSIFGCTATGFGCISVFLGAWRLFFGVPCMLLVMSTVFSFLSTAFLPQPRHSTLWWALPPPLLLAP